MTPQLASENGIAIIYQEFNNVKELSAAENLFLGRPIRKGIVIDKKAMEEEAAKAFEALHIKIDPKALMKNLTVGYQQMVEIAKAVQQNAKILIMDEPSAPLTSAEVESMFEVVERLRKEGVSIIYISHRLEEIYRLSDRILVMRDGEYVKTLITKDSEVQELIKLMVGRELTQSYPPRKDCVKKDEVVLELQNVTGNGDTDISLKIHKGEILGLGGLVGAGRTELAMSLFGKNYGSHISGQEFIRGEEVHLKNEKDAIFHGLAYATEDRKTNGLILSDTIARNTTMARMEKISNRFGVIDVDKENKVAEEYVKRMRTKTPGIFQKAGNLSGGNQQKVLLSKWMFAEPDVLFLDEPGRGIDVGAKYEIYCIMNEMVKEGKAVVMISSELPELLGMCDRIYIMNEGKLVGELEASEATQERIMDKILSSNDEKEN